jgi:catechol 2,3-dioxygenase-like lactoylglutathione lyase family enzyme
LSDGAKWADGDRTERRTSYVEIASATIKGYSHENRHFTQTGGEATMFDHVGIRVADCPRSKRFYEVVLAPLGISLQKELTPEMTGGEAHCGFGGTESVDFWIGTTSDPASGPVHVAFIAKDRAAVRAFHAAAMGIGATDNGGPGLRPIYHPEYYGAFVLDPDGNNIEAVCHNPE